MIVIPVRTLGAYRADDLGTTLHFPFMHPQLPAPQSSGPEQTIVQYIPVQDGRALSFTQLDG